MNTELRQCKNCSSVIKGESGTGCTNCSGTLCYVCCKRKETDTEWRTEHRKS